MANQNLQVRSYVNGTLYSILTREKLQQKAKQIDLEHMLKQLKEHSNKQFLKQIQYILEQLQTPPNDDTKSDQDDFNDDANQDDEFDPQIQQRITEQEHKQAENLLLSDFSAPQQLASEYYESVQRFMQLRRQNRKASVHQSVNDESGLIVGGASMSGIVAGNGGGAMRASSGGIINTSNIGGAAAAGGVATGGGTINSSMIVADNSNTQRPKVRPATPGVKVPSVPMDPQPPEMRKLPSELQSRPKIPRTPIGGKRAKNDDDIKNQQNFRASPFEVKQGQNSNILQASQNNKVSEKKENQGQHEESPNQPENEAYEEEKTVQNGKNAMTQTQMNNFKQAFTKRDKLARTPPNKKNKITSNHNNY